MKKLTIVIFIVILFLLFAYIIVQGAEDIQAPSDHIKNEQITTTDEFVILSIKDPILADFKDTGSMIPILNEYSTGIEIIPKSEQAINIGDIIVYEKNGEQIIHRVKYIKEEDGEKVFILKGDSDSFEEKVRFKDIRYILVGVLY